MSAQGTAWRTRVRRTQEERDEVQQIDEEIAVLRARRTQLNTLAHELDDEMRELQYRRIDAGHPLNFFNATRDGQRLQAQARGVEHELMGLNQRLSTLRGRRDQLNRAMHERSRRGGGTGSLLARAFR